MSTTKSPSQRRAARIPENAAQQIAVHVAALRAAHMAGDIREERNWVTPKEFQAFCSYMDRQMITIVQMMKQIDQDIIRSHSGLSRRLKKLKRRRK